MNNPPKVSIITVVKDCADTIKKTIQSIIRQDYAPIEYVIIDGGSTDGTIETVKEYESVIHKWISEPDEGIFDAMNKGLAISTGDYIQFIHADDQLGNDQIVNAVHVLQDNPIYDFVFGDLLLLGHDGNPLYQIKGDRHYHNRILYRMPAMNHPTLMCRRRVYDHVGGFRNFKVAMDYDWLVRAHLSGAKGFYTDSVTACMAAGGISERQVLQAFKEVRKIARHHARCRLRANLWYFLCRSKYFTRCTIENRFSKRPVNMLRRFLFPNVYSLSERRMEND